MAELRSIFILSIFAFIFADAKFAFEVYKPFVSNVGDADCGDPLYLTPMIEAGKIKEAQTAAKVDIPGIKWIKSYSGYITVNKAFDSNQFFWYFKAAIDPKNAPVVLWLQGGPGASSLYGLFFENGPFRFKRGKLVERYYSWHKNQHLIYIDNPVGTGFSFTKDGYARNETVVGKDLYNCLVQFFQLFPELQKNEFYVTGESYAGKYIPAVSYAIHKNNANAKLKINLQGFSIGNGFTDPINQFQYSDYLYQIGLVDYNGRKIIKDYEERGVEYIKNAEWDKAFDIFDNVIFGGEDSAFYNLTGYTSFYNFMNTASTDDEKAFAELMDSTWFRRGIHVGNITFDKSAALVQSNLQADVMQSVADWMSELLSYYRAVVYNGQLDIIVAYPLTENYLRKLNFTGCEEFRNATRQKWKVDDDLAGFAKSAGNLTEVLVRNAGHMVPGNQPKWAVDLLYRLTRNKSFF